FAALETARGAAATGLGFFLAFGDGRLGLGRARRARGLQERGSLAFAAVFVAQDVARRRRCFTGQRRSGLRIDDSERIALLAFAPIFAVPSVLVAVARALVTVAAILAIPAGAVVALTVVTLTV